MKIETMKTLLDAEVFSGEDNLELDIEYAFATDMMSDVLVYAYEQSVLITAVCNPQVVRTAEMMDMQCIIFVENKRPDENLTQLESILQLAERRNIVLLCTQYDLFNTCGILYGNGLPGRSKQK